MRRFLWRRSTRSPEKGSVLVEAAVVVPLLIIILVGLADFGRAFATMSSAQKALRGAARYLTLLPASAVCTWGFTKATNLAKYGHIEDPTTGEVPRLNTVSLVTPTTCTEATLKTTPIRLQATVTYTPIILSVWAFTGNINLTVEHEQRWIGQ